LDYSVHFITAVTQRLLDSSVVFSFDQTGYHRHSQNFDEQDLDVDLSGQVMLITGANSGIGFAAALELAKRNAEVHLLCRNEKRGKEAEQKLRDLTHHPKIYFQQIDVSDFESIRHFVQHWGNKKIDVLIHNAGVMPPTRTITQDGLESTLATNLVGPFCLTRELTPCFQKSQQARILFVSSGGMYLNRLNVKKLFETEGPFDSVEAYACTKRAQVVLSELLADRLKNLGVAVHSMHPGWADTPAVRASLPRFYRLTRRILRTPAQGADTLVWLAARPEASFETGLFYFDRKSRDTHVIKSTRETRKDREELWKSMCEATGINADEPWE
jgi:dehydrogenase/reductase SDR family member 12